MITGEIKNRIDSIWDTFWTGGITNSITILEQMTYLFFMKMLDDAQRTKEANANAMGVAVSEPTPTKTCDGARSRTMTPRRCTASSARTCLCSSRT